MITSTGKLNGQLQLSIELASMCYQRVVGVCYQRLYVCTWLPNGVRCKNCLRCCNVLMSFPSSSPTLFLLFFFEVIWRTTAFIGWRCIDCLCLVMLAGVFATVVRADPMRCTLSPLAYTEVTLPRY